MAVIFGTNTANFLQGTAEHDIIKGWDAANAVVGDEGPADDHDELNGGTNDSVFGGNGNDRLYAGGSNTLLDGGDGNDTLIVDDNSLNSSVQGGVGLDWLSLMTHLPIGYSLSVADSTLVQTLANGTTVVGIEALFVRSTGGNANIVGGEFNDDIFVHGNNNIVRGGGGADTLTSFTGNNIIHGDDGDDIIDSGDGQSQIFGDAGDDFIIANNGSAGTVFDGGDGIDTLRYIGGFSSTAITLSMTNSAEVANFEKLVFIGSRHGDTVVGGNLSDNFSGGLGDDWFEGGAGADQYYFGGGYDTLSYRNSAEGINFSYNTSTGGDAAGDTFTSGVEQIIASNYNDTISAQLDVTSVQSLNGDDTLTLDFARLKYDGGDGFDTLVLNRNAEDYRIYRQPSAGLLTVVDPLTQVKTVGVEAFQFRNGTKTVAELEQNAFDVRFASVSNVSSQRVAGFPSFDVVDFSITLDAALYAIESIHYKILKNGVPVDILWGPSLELLPTTSPQEFRLYLAENTVVNDGDLFTVVLSNPSISVAIQTAEASGYYVATEPDDLDPGFAVISGTADVDKLFGTEGDDVLIGLQGADFLDGGAGFDLLQSVSEDATASVPTQGIIANLSKATVRVGGVTVGAQKVHDGFGFIDTVRNIEAVAGTAFNDYMYGGSGSNYFFGFGGNDYIKGGAGFDILDFTQDIENTSIEGFVTGVVVNLGSKHNSVEGIKIATNTARDRFGNIDKFSSIEAFVGSSEDDYFFGGRTKVDFHGEAGNDYLVGSSASDYLDGGEGTDDMSGGNGNDIYVVDSTGDTIFESINRGTDTIETQLDSFDLSIVSYIENLTYIGGTSFNGVGDFNNNVMTGGKGADLLDGSFGKDKLIGGQGNDMLTGGLGADTFIFSALTKSGDFGTDTITDFQAGRGVMDVVKIHKSWGFTTAAKALAALTIVGEDKVLVIDTDTSITFAGHANTVFAKDDFLIG